MNATSRTVTICAGFLFAAGALGFLAIRGMSSPSPAGLTPVSQPGSEEDAHTRMVQRGAYLMTVMDCQACHTPKGPDARPIPGMTLAGHPADAPLPEWDPSLLKRNILATMDPTLTAFAGPFGVSVAPNLTPDKETGIGNLSAEGLILSWRTGKHWRHDRPIMPPMPYENYAALTDDDIRALHAFLMTLPPVRNKAPESQFAGSTGGPAH